MGLFVLTVVGVCVIDGDVR